MGVGCQILEACLLSVRAPVHDLGGQQSAVSSRQGWRDIKYLRWTRPHLCGQRSGCAQAQVQPLLASMVPVTAGCRLAGGGNMASNQGAEGWS